MFGQIDKTFQNLMGKEHKFYGVDGNCFKLGPKVFEAVEDESDGYRSYLGSLEVRNKDNLIFFRRSLARVHLVESDGGAFEGYMLIDLDSGHVWLRFGTDYADDYYPMFVFEYKPKQGE